MGIKIVVSLLLLLVGYWMILLGLDYDVYGTPRPNEYFIRDKTSVDEVTKLSDSDDSINRRFERTQEAKD